ncbi:hypothetical protein [Haladaptatus caseinilyticus]|uniref:hypothetical protein n=1 Tax=Haladaptatus caseinilyticus TaxID=2993314 RepID=UPI00224AF0D7|nr:hypothetical protein [Haladaptatus caseinilyticus]
MLLAGVLSPFGVTASAALFPFDGLRTAVVALLWVILHLLDRGRHAGRRRERVFSGCLHTANTNTELMLGKQQALRGADRLKSERG